MRRTPSAGVPLRAGFRPAREGYAMLIALILLAVIAIIGATSLSVAGVDERVATHNRRHMIMVNTAAAGTEHARAELMTEDPPNEGWDTADTGPAFVTAAEGEADYVGIDFPMSQGVYEVNAVFQKCANPPPGYSTEAGRTQYRSDFWDMQSVSSYVDATYVETNPTKATVVATLRKVVHGSCKIR